MRDISATLLSAQKFEQTRGGKTGTRIPYVELVFHSKDGATTPDYADRQKGIMYREATGLGYEYGSAVIQLRNNDHLVEDLVGQWVDIVLGDYYFNDSGTITGYDGKHLPRLWVESQDDLSFPGTKDIALKLHDVWKLLADSPCIMDDNISAPYHYVRYSNEITPWGVINHLINQARFCSMMVLEADDGFIDTFISSGFFINGHYYDLIEREGTISEDYKGRYESFLDVIKRALSYTFCYLIVIGGWDKPLLKLVYPQESDEVDETYYSYQAPWFNEFVYRENIVTPNLILTYCDYDFENGVFNNPDNILTGQARDQDSIDKYAHEDYLGDGIVAHIEWCPDITDQANADSVAEAILSRQKVASHGGRLIIPHDIRVELYDKVEVWDAR